MFHKQQFLWLQVPPLETLKISNKAVVERISRNPYPDHSFISFEHTFSKSLRNVPSITEIGASKQKCLVISLKIKYSRQENPFIT